MFQISEKQMQTKEKYDNIEANIKQRKEKITVFKIAERNTAI